MTKQDIYNAPGYAGIYCFINKLTGKTYVGSAIKLQKKLKEHWRTFEKPIRIPDKLSSEVRQAGIENFELKILNTIWDALSWKTPGQLQQQLQKYVSEYGYESLEEAGKTQFINCDNLPVSKEELIKCRDITTDQEIVFGSVEDASEVLEISKTVINNCLQNVQTVGSKKYLFAKYTDDYPTIPEYDTWDFDDFLKEQFKALSTAEHIMTYIKENPDCTYGELRQNYDIPKKLFYEYKHLD